MKTVSDLKVAIFADGAEKAGMLGMYAKPYIKGFTTNPTLMRNAGVSDYESFAREILREIPDRPISFEVFADDFTEMARQARKIATWGKNIRVKIPITNTRRESAVPLCEQLTQEGIPLNVTALFTLDQVQAAAQQECAPNTLATPVRTDWYLQYCPLLLPARATYTCSPNK